MDNFVQKYICRLFALNTILAGQYACVNVIYTYYKLKSNSALVPHIKGAYRGMEVIYNKILYSILFTAYTQLHAPASVHSCAPDPSNTKLVGSR
jgi:hypothetical protein